MPDLHLRARPTEARERIEHPLRPLLARQNQLPLRALLVPRVVRLAGQREAPERDARVDDPRAEDVRVRAREDARHHRARGRACGEDARGVDVPVGERKARGGGDAERVAAAVVRERCRGGDVPARPGVGLGMREDENEWEGGKDSNITTEAHGRREEDDVAVRLCEGGELGA